MAHFEFISHWRIRSPLEPVWARINDYETWPAWWRGVEEVNVVRRGAADHVGALNNQVWKSALPYRLRFQIEITKVEPMHVIEVAADGELRGTGVMSFATEGDITVVTFVWKVETTSTWMNMLAPVAAPLFRWNHGAIMDWGAESLAKKLGAELVGTTER